MPQQVLKILTDVEWPDVNKCFNFRTTRPTHDCLMPGLFIEIINLITSRLNIKAQFIAIDEFSSMAKTTDLSDLILENLKNGTFDFLSGYFDNSTIYGDGFLTTAPVYPSETKYIVARAQVLTGMFSFLTVYDFYLWLGIFGTFLLVALTGSIMYCLAPKNVISERKSFGSVTWQLYRLKLMQYEPIQGHLVSLNTLIFTFALFNCGLLVQIYHGLITTKTIQKIDPRPFKGHEIFQVLKERRYSLILKSKFNWWHYDILNSAVSPFFELRQALNDNPLRLATDENGDMDLDEYVNQKVVQGRWITIQTNEQLAVTRNQGYCNFVAFNTNFPPKTKHLLMRKGHPLLHKINKVFLDDVIFLRRLHDKYYKHTNNGKCAKNKKGPKALSLTPYFGIVILLAAGVSAGAIAFFVELWMNKKLR